MPGQSNSLLPEATLPTSLRQTAAVGPDPTPPAPRARGSLSRSPRPGLSQPSATHTCWSDGRAPPSPRHDPLPSVRHVSSASSPRNFRFRMTQLPLPHDGTSASAGRGPARSRRCVCGAAGGSASLSRCVERVFGPRCENGRVAGSLRLGTTSKIIWANH